MINGQLNGLFSEEEPSRLFYLFGHLSVSGCLGSFPLSAATQSFLPSGWIAPNMLTFTGMEGGWFWPPRVTGLDLLGFQCGAHLFSTARLESGTFKPRLLVLLCSTVATPPNMRTPDRGFIADPCFLIKRFTGYISL